MNVLIVYAHPEPASFNGAMKDVAVETLTTAGHAVTVSDLYAMRFNAVVGAEDFRGERVDAARLTIAAEQTALENLSKELADRIITSLALHLRKGVAARP